MRQQFFPLQLPTNSDGTPMAGLGVSVEVSALREKYVHTVGLTAGGAVVLEGTIDGVNWSTVAPALTNGWLAIAQPLKALRLNTTAGAISAGTVGVAGFDSRTQ